MFIAKNVLFLSLYAVAASAAAADGTSVIVNGSSAVARLTSEDSARFAAAFGDAEPLFESDGVSIDCRKATECQVILDLLDDGYELTPYERIVRLDAEGSTRLADALEGLPFVLSPGIGDVKHLATTDQIVRIVCQIPELFPEGPRCQAAIKR